MPTNTDRPGRPDVPPIGTPEDFLEVPRWDRFIPDFTKPDARFVAIPGASTAPATYNRTGYVLDYRLELHPMRMGGIAEFFPGRPSPFFRMFVVDNAPGSSPDANAEEFVLVRNWTIPGMDLDASGNLPTVTYGNVEQAIVATAKDALLHGKRVSITWQYPVNAGGDDVDINGPKLITILRLFR